MSAAGKPLGRAVDRAETELRDLILSGDLGPGERLGEVELAAVLGMSRTPVREALRRLSSQGLVDVRSNKGARVIAWSDAELEQMFVLRSLLEGQAAAATARRATDADAERLDRMARQMSGGRGDPLRRSDVLPTFDMGPPLETILERALDETGLQAPTAPRRP